MNDTNGEIVIYAYGPDVVAFETPGGDILVSSRVAIEMCTSLIKAAKAASPDLTEEEVCSYMDAQNLFTKIEGTIQ